MLPALRSVTLRSLHTHPPRLLSPPFREEESDPPDAAAWGLEPSGYDWTPKLHLNSLWIPGDMLGSGKSKLLGRLACKPHALHHTHKRRVFALTVSPFIPILDILHNCSVLGILCSWMQRLLGARDGNSTPEVWCPPIPFRFSAVDVLPSSLRDLESQTFQLHQDSTHTRQHLNIWCCRNSGQIVTHPK